MQMLTYTTADGQEVTFGTQRMPLYTLTNSFNNYHKVTLKSEWIDSVNDGSIKSVKYLIRNSSGETVMEPECSAGSSVDVYLPQSSGYTITQESYTVNGLVDGEGRDLPVMGDSKMSTIGVEGRTFRAFDTKLSLADGQRADAFIIQMWDVTQANNQKVTFYNTRKVYDATVNTTFEPQPEASDPVLTKTLNYQLKYQTYVGGTPAVRSVNGINNSVSSWTQTSSGIPSYSLDGGPTSCDVSLATLDDLFRDYDQLITRVDGTNQVTFTIHNKIKTAEINVRKRWEERATRPEGGQATRPTAVTVLLRSTDGSVSRTLTLRESDGWAGIFEDLPIKKIARIMQLPENTVKSHLHRGKQHLAALIGER
jgi:hypothetical protein